MSRSRAQRPSLIQVSVVTFLVVLATVGYWQWSQVTEEEKETLRGPPPEELSRFELIRDWVSRGAEAVPEVIEALADEDPMIRRSAARALGQIGPPAREAIPALHAALVDAHEDVRIDSASALVSVNGPSPELLAEISALCSDESPMVRREIVTVLQKVGPAAMPLMVEYLRGTDPASRSLAVEVLRPMIEPRRAGDGTIIPTEVTALPAETREELLTQFRQMIDDDDPRVRQTARITLARADATTIDELKQWILDPNEDIALAALSALERSGPAAAAVLPELVDYLLQRLQVKNVPGMREYTPEYQALAIIGRLQLAAKPAVEPLVAMLQDERLAEQLLTLLLQVLPQIGAEREQLIGPLTKLVHDERFAVAISAAHLLKKVAPATMRDQVPLLCRSLKDPDSPAAASVLQIIGCLGPSAEPALPQLIALLKGGKIRTQARAAWIISTIGPGAADAVPEMLRIIDQKERDYDLLEAIISAAGSIGPAASSLGPFVLQHAVKPSREPHGDRLHRAAIRAGMRMGLRQREYIAAVHAALRSEDPSENFVAMDALSAAGSPDRTVLLEMLRHLESRNSLLRLVAALSIDDIVGPDPDVIKALARRLGDSSHDVRIAAAESLGQLGPPAAPILPDLNRVLDDEESTIPLLRLPNYHRLLVDSNLFPTPNRVISESFCVARVIEEAMRKIGEEGR